MPQSAQRPARIVIIGGVAAGATAAAKARRENEDAEIIVLERGPYVSFANCGLPFHLSGEIEHRSALLLQSPETLLERYNLDVRPGHEVIAIDRANHTVTVRLSGHAREAITEAAHRECPDPDMAAGTEFPLAWDRLILAMGGAPLLPELKGGASANCFTLWTMQDMDRIDAFIKAHRPKNAVILGASYIGLEAAEALNKLGLKVRMVEQATGPMPVLDPEFSRLLKESLDDAGIEVMVQTKAIEIDANHHVVIIQPERAGESELSANAPRSIPADLVILAVGTRPNAALAQASGLEIGHTGGLVVNRHLQASRDSSIYVAGDLAEIPFRSDKQSVRLPLAGPANRQGRIAGANAARSLLPAPPALEIYPGAMGTSILRVLKHAVAMTGLSEKAAAACGIRCSAVIVHRTDRAAYYRDARLLSLKIVYNLDNGAILGAQAFGQDGVDKRIDVLATAMQAGMNVRQLAELDLSYAPPFNSANDPINFAGMVAANNLSGYARSTSPAEFLRGFDIHQDLVLDVRMPSEHVNGAVPGSLNIPVDEIRQRLAEIPRDRRTIFVHCAVGFRAHIAIRILMQKGFAGTVNISGGWSSLRHFFPQPGPRTHH